MLTDIEINYRESQTKNAPLRYPKDLVEELAAKNFTNDRKTSELLTKHYKADWKDKCERGLYLAKRLGNIYTGSLYNGLLSLICDRQIDLTGKQVLMFSYGSGCAASMFILHFRSQYKSLQTTCDFVSRLDRRLKVSPKEYE